MPSSPEPRNSLTSRGRDSDRPRLARGAQHRIRNDVTRSLLERCQLSQGIHPSLGVRGGLDRDQVAPPFGQRAGLVEDRGAYLGQRLDRGTAFHQDAGPRSARNTADEGHGGSEDQRARGCDDENGERADRIARRSTMRQPATISVAGSRKIANRSAIRMNGAFAVWAASTMRTIPA